MAVNVVRLAGNGRRGPRPGLQMEEPAVFDRGYWLAHCDGFRVDGREGRIGLVHSVREEPDGSVLAVLAGRLGRRVLLIAAEEVEFIVPRAQRIWLRSPLAVRGTEPLTGGGAPRARSESAG